MVSLILLMLLVVEAVSGSSVFLLRKGAERL